MVFIRETDATLASAVGLNGPPGTKHRPRSTHLRAVKPVSEGLQMPARQVVRQTGRRTESLPPGALVVKATGEGR